MASQVENVQAVLNEMRHARQTRQYHPDAVPETLVNELLEVARWSGSSRNTQPWHFIVITDNDLLAKIAAIRTPINWVASAPMAIAIVLDGSKPVDETFDEGRVTERLLIAARLLGLGAGTAWVGDASQQTAAKSMLGIPEEKTFRSVVAIGYPVTHKDHRPNPAQGGRKPLNDIVSYDQYEE